MHGATIKIPVFVVGLRKYINH